MSTDNTTLCKGCDGAGFQTRNDGIRVHCPMCVPIPTYALPVTPYPPAYEQPFDPPYKVTCESNLCEGELTGVVLDGVIQ